MTEIPPLGVLGSYAIERGPAGMRHAQAFRDAGLPVVWDSGAFSVFTGTASIDADSHAEWVAAQEHDPSTRFLALDVIGDAEGTLANYRRQRIDHGVPVEPTIHFGDPVQQVDRLLEVEVPEWINLGGLVPYLAQPAEARRCAAFVAAVRKRLPDSVRIHVLGCVHPAVGKLVHHDAGDSTRWLSPRRDRHLMLWDDARADWRRYPVSTTTGIEGRREKSWESAYRDGRWLRETYSLDPVEMTVEPDSYRLLAVSIESMRRYALWLGAHHGRPTTVYLAGAILSRAAREAVLTPAEGVAR